MTATQIPEELKRFNQWVCWTGDTDPSGKVRNKIPVQPNGRPASTTNCDTWNSFEECQKAVTGSVRGVGFVFTGDDNYVGVDLDNCRDEQTGAIQRWASEIIDRLNTYTEISPSKTGLKLFVRAETAVKGRKIGLPQGAGGIEVYSRGRYFTVTGLSVRDNQIRDNQPALDWLQREYFGSTVSVTPSVSSQAEKCWRELAKIADSVQGKDGSGRMFNALCEIVRWGLIHEEGLQLARKFNVEKCHPPWSDVELEHKWRDAVTQSIINSDFGCRSPVFATGVEKQCRGYSCNLQSANSLIANPPPQTYLIDNVMAEGQPMLIGGAHKTLKTSLMLDMAMSLTSGGHFLGKYEVLNPAPCIVISGESGVSTIAKSLSLIAQSKGLSDVGPLHIGFDLPAMTDPSHMKELESNVKSIAPEGQASVLIVDPAYLSLLRSAAGMASSDVFAMGSILHEISSFCSDIDVTLVLCHHTNKQNRKPSLRAPSLADLSMAGFSEYARQWVLVGRRSEYSYQGYHELVCQIGGSAGHSSEIFIDVDEGSTDSRKWSISFPSSRA